METKAVLQNEADNVTTIFQLGYASAATVPFGPKELTELLAKARANNTSLGLTGMLLYHQGSFIQILEGEERTVEQLYARIAEDPRHANAMLLFRASAASTSGQWGSIY